VRGRSQNFPPNEKPPFFVRKATEPEVAAQSSPLGFNYDKEIYHIIRSLPDAPHRIRIFLIA
jgi:hypothetical protein